LFISFILVKFLLPSEISAIPKGKEYLRSELEKLGKMTWGATWSVIVFILALVLWFMPGFLALAYGEKSAAVTWCNTHLETSSIALLLAVLLLAVPINWKEKKFALTWGEANKAVSWGTILLIAGGITMGGALVKTGVAKWVGDVLISAIPNATPLVITLTCTLLAYVLTQFCSNIASIMVVGPIAISFAQAAGINPLQSLMAVTLTVSMAFVFPISTPPNAIVYGSGYLKMVSFIKSGLVVSFIVSLVTAVMVHFITAVTFPM
jgi:sodium-dependent dicarboxylate transporter 2/3/5